MWWSDHHGMDDRELDSRLPTLEMLRRVGPYVRPHRWAFLFSFALSLVAVAMTLGQLTCPRLCDHIQS